MVLANTKWIQWPCIRTLGHDHLLHIPSPPSSAGA
jgi:hypothetical protein